ncbi:hypothetical protein C1H76_1964 [Elsinoe australis]|uniref:Uncharacterized protein n=1 Tax=Elsinoe australis TaxID=40998 RepID=A0A4U7B3D8_9PEZI|nr:hypothetical protein C1H76_1964 [Elsinoe australis]
MSRLDRYHKPPVLEVFTQDRTTGSWRATTTDLASFTTEHNANRTSPPKIQIAFLTVPIPGPSPASVLTPQDQTHLQSLIGFKSSYWSPAQQQAAGYFSLHCPRPPSPGTLIAVTITKFLIKKAHASDPSRPSRPAIAHDWIGIDVLCRWTRDGSGANARTGVLALVPCSPPCVRDGIASLLHGQFAAGPLSTADPFGVLDPVLEYAGGLFEEAIWSWRDHVRWF